MTTPQPAALPELLREIVAYCREAGHDWSSLAEAENRLAALQSQPAAAGVSDEQCKALTALFKDAMDWGRSYGQRINLSSITVADVSEAYSEKARAILALRPQAVPMTEEEFLSNLDSRGIGPMDPCMALEIKELVEAYYGITAQVGEAK